VRTGVSYFGNRMPEHYRGRDLPEIAAAGCTYVLHTFSENDLAFYRETMGDIVAATHEVGLDVVFDPWGVGGVFAGEAESRLLLDHPDAWQQGSDGALVPAACPLSPDLRTLIERWVDATAAVGADSVLWDEPGFGAPGPDGSRWTCRCARCQNEYRQSFGESMPLRQTPNVLAFREKLIIGLVEWCCRVAHERGLRNTVCLPAQEDHRASVQDWDAIARLQDVDALAVTPFWALWGKDVDPYVSQYAGRLVATCRANGREPQVWLQSFLIPTGREEEIARAADAAVAAGVEDIAAWGYRGCGHMSSLRCADPEAAWSAIGRMFRRFRGIDSGDPTEPRPAAR